MSKILVKAYCGSTIKTDFFNEEECTWENYVELDIDDFNNGSAKKKCPKCDFLLEQGNGHFTLDIDHFVDKITDWLFTDNVGNRGYYLLLGRTTFDAFHKLTYIKPDIVKQGIKQIINLG